MSMAERETRLVTGEIYHIYNRGVDKRIVFTDQWESQRFLECMQAFNRREPVGSLRNILQKNSDETTDKEPLVEIMAYCLNPNHFHLLLRQVSDGGISEFMKRLSGGYTWYFNQKHGRSGSLFQGVFRESHIGDNDYLLHVSAYINLNDRVHSYSGETAVVIRSSWEEYRGKASQEKEICSKEAILGQFSHRTEYERFALQSLGGIRERKAVLKGWFHE